MPPSLAESRRPWQTPVNQTEISGSVSTPLDFGNAFALARLESRASTLPETAVVGTPHRKYTIEAKDEKALVRHSDPMDYRALGAKTVGCMEVYFRFVISNLVCRCEKTRGSVVLRALMTADWRVRADRVKEPRRRWLAYGTVWVLEISSHADSLGKLASVCL